MNHREEMLAQPEEVMAKGQRRSNREAKKPKKTPAERATAAAAKTAAATVAVALGSDARAWQKRR